MSNPRPDDPATGPDGRTLAPRPSNHPARDRRGLDAVSLVIGTVFLGLAGGWALTWTGVMPYTGLGWYLPLLLVIAGLLGVLVSRRRS